MIDLHFRTPEYVTPPGTMVQILSHPYYSSSKAVELALFNEHRYAFFFWNKWVQEREDYSPKNHAPCLVSLDWHQDLIHPCEIEKEWLSQLDTSNAVDVSLYSWANLRSLNDAHILASAYLNKVGNIYIHCRQGNLDSDWEDEKLIDKYGNTHTIKKFKTYEELESCMLDSDETEVFFDIDLDFFTINNPYSIGGGKSKSFSYLKNSEIKEMLTIERPLVNWIFQRLSGFTIALEPEHTGGLLKSYQLLNTISKLYFTPSPFANHGEHWEKNTKWKHLLSY